MRLGRERPRKGGEPGARDAVAVASMRLGRERPRKLAAAHDYLALARKASMRLGRERPRKDLASLGAAIVVRLQ